MRSNNRLRCETHNISIGADETSVGHRLKVSLAYGHDGHLRELVFVGRGKGDGITHLLEDLGITLSRIIQGRDGNTGKDVT